MTFQKSMHFLAWMNYFKIAFSVLVFSLVYLLLDTKRTELVGKITLSSMLTGATLTILSIKFSELNNALQIPTALFIISFIGVIYSKIEFVRKSSKMFFLSIYLLPVGILLKLSNATFYRIGMLVLLLISSMVIYQTIKKKVI
jgi:hypothetical protein